MSKTVFNDFFVQSELARITKLFTDDPEPPVKTASGSRLHFSRRGTKTSSKGLLMINEILDTEDEEVSPFHSYAHTRAAADELETSPLSLNHFIYRRLGVFTPSGYSGVAGHAFEDLERLQIVEAEKRSHVYNSATPKEAMQTEILDPFIRAPLGRIPVPSYYAPSSSKQER